MPNRNLWNKNVPRVEYDYRARDARLRLERVERLLMRRDAAVGSRFGLLRLLISNIAGSGGRRGRRTGSPNDRRPCGIGTPCPASFVFIKEHAVFCRA
jgi:hypothetical protein